jgi:hypothetical protein
MKKYGWLVVAAFALTTAVFTGGMPKVAAQANNCQTFAGYDKTGTLVNSQITCAPSATGAPFNPGTTYTWTADQLFNANFFFPPSGTATSGTFYGSKGAIDIQDSYWDGTSAQTANWSIVSCPTPVVDGFSAALLFNNVAPGATQCRTANTMALKLDPDAAIIATLQGWTLDTEGGLEFGYYASSGAPYFTITASGGATPELTFSSDQGTLFQIPDTFNQTGAAGCVGVNGGGGLTPYILTKGGANCVTSVGAGYGISVTGANDQPAVNVRDFLNNSDGSINTSYVCYTGTFTAAGSTQAISYHAAFSLATVQESANDTTAGTAVTTTSGISKTGLTFTGLTTSDVYYWQTCGY